MVNLLDISSFFSNLENIIGSKYAIFSVAVLSFFIKLYLLTKLLSNTFKNKKTHTTLSLLIIFIVTSMISDTGWVFKFTREILFPSMDYRYSLFWIRITWVFNVIQFHSLSLFIESLIKNEKLFGLRQKIFIPITLTISLLFLIVAITQFNNITPPTKSVLLKTIFNIQLFYNLYALLLLSAIITIVKLTKANLPKILNKQLKIFLYCLIAPYIATDLIHYYPFNVFQNFMNNMFALSTLSNILTTAAIYYSIKKVIGLRFLNMQDTHSSKKEFNFIQDFQAILEQFSQTTSIEELRHITQNFFKTAFCIPMQKTKFYIRKINNNNQIQTVHEHKKIETFISSNFHGCCIEHVIKKEKILVKDDIEFNNYYKEDKLIKKIIIFLNNINASIFIPIYEKNKLIAYILVENHIHLKRNGSKSEFYTDEEKDQMVVFSNYLGNMINLLQNRNLKTLIQKEKDLQEELYSKHQEINQYKESIRSLLNKNKDKKIGIMFYKNRHFVFGNQIAKNLITINPNINDKHPITKELKKITNQVLQYKSPQTSIINDPSGNKLVLYGIPNTEGKETIIAIHYPEISDILKKHINLLKDPTKWDFLLYLETTKSGKLINELIPGTGETLLNFKIELLKTALSKKAILLDIPEQDLIPTVEMLHHISFRENLHVLHLKKLIKTAETAIKLFGVNHIFEIDKNTVPLLEKLDNTGTLFIKNIHLLDLETQNCLATFIKYGFYKPFKGEQALYSNVRIICSTNINLKIAVQDGKFSKQLLNELKKTSLCMPPIMTLPEKEITNLTNGFAKQVEKSLQLTNIEEKNIINSKPTSLFEIKERVIKLLEKKSKQHNFYEDTKTAEIANDEATKDQEIIEAARLGKQALKDPKIMSMLWYKFKNQNKIANLLGVNRSSVNRRCREYDLL